MKGNVIDMAVGVVIGGAFGKIVTSLVSDIIMPLVSAATAGVDFTEWKWVIRKAVMDGDTVVKEAVTINWGNFLQVILDFLIIALCIFAAIRALNKATSALKKPEEAKPEAPAPKPDNVVLLEEIRDILKKQEK
jgi:large conductance mechanosensitive channel